MRCQLPKLARGTPRTRQWTGVAGGARETPWKSLPPLPHWTITGGERDRTSSGEVEADKLAGPAHASLSE